MAKRRQFSNRPFISPESWPNVMIPAKFMPTPYPVPSLNRMGQGDAGTYKYNPQANIRDIGSFGW